MADTMLQFTDLIRKPDTDRRGYRHIQLENGLKILVISDPESEKAAACMRVEIGSLKDPDELPGLAHFCEHMLFLGTEKYPKENDYFEFVTQHGGSCNACTLPNATMFFFDVAPGDLHGTLDRFLQFFLHPLFNESATEREVMAVDSENAKNFQLDGARIKQVNKATSKPGHAYGKFSTGNKDSLMVHPAAKGINVREELIKFHECLYSSNLMSLCVLGKETLDELTEVVTKMFSAVVNKGVPLPICVESPFTEKELQVRIEVVPVKQMMELSMAFPIPDLQKHYRTQPTHYIAHLIGHEGPGSVLSVLKVRGWATGLCAGPSKLGRGFWIFLVTVDLTEEGEYHTNEIVELVFQYFAMLRKEGPKEWIFRECANMNEVEFRFSDQQTAMSTVTRMASSMKDFPPEEIICGHFLMTEYKPELIDSVLQLLKPQNLRLVLVGQRFHGQTSQVEPWYLVDYNVEKIDEELISTWSKVQLSDALFLPEKNEFIPDNFDLVPPPSNPMDVPVIIQDSPMCTVFFKHDDRFKVPKVYYRIQFASPLAYDTPENCGLLDLYGKLLQDSLNEYAYMAEIAGIEYELLNTVYGMEVVVTGYSDKLKVLLLKIVERMTKLEVNSMKFQMYLDMRLRKFRNFRADQPYNHAMYYVSLLMTDHVWSKAELLSGSENLKPDDVKDFFPKFFRRLHITMLAYGNTTVQNVTQVVGSVEDILKKTFGCCPPAPGQLRRKRQVQLTSRSQFVFETENQVHSSSCTAVYFQVGLEDTANNLLLEMLNQVISEPCFTQLRTKEQLGYIVLTSPKRSDGVQGLLMLVQSPKHPALVEERMESFLKTIEETFCDLSIETFERHRSSLTVERTEKPKKLKKQGSKYWYEISTKSYHFKRDEVEVEYLQTITKESVLAFYKEQIAMQGSARRKLSIHVMSKEAKDKGFEATDSSSTDGVQPVVIENVQSFRDLHSLYPVPPPYAEPVKLLQDAGTIQK